MPQKIGDARGSVTAMRDHILAYHCFSTEPPRIFFGTLGRATDSMIVSLRRPSNNRSMVPEEKLMPSSRSSSPVAPKFLLHMKIFSFHLMHALVALSVLAALFDSFRPFALLFDHFSFQCLAGVLFLAAGWSAWGSRGVACLA